MTRAMTLIKMYFIGTLKALAADVQRRLTETVGSVLVVYQPTRRTLMLLSGPL